MKKVFALYIFIFYFLQLTAQQNTLKRMWTTPYVLPSNEGSFSFQIEKKDSQSQIDSIQGFFLGEPYPFGDTLLSQEGKITDRITFLDDGLKDDLLANDGIYTASNLKSLLIINENEIHIPKSHNFKMREMIFFSEGSDLTEQSNLNFQVRRYEATSVPEIYQVNSNFQHTSHVANIVDEDLEYEEYNLHQAYETYYEHFPDDRHSIILLSTEISKNTPSVSGRSFRVANDIQGIGLGIFDYSENYHSNGVLEQHIILVNGGEDSGVLLHELHHRWGIKTHPEFHMNLSGHWLPTFEMNGGGDSTDIVEKIISNGDNTYNVYYNIARNWNTFHPIDMYLAGYGSLDDIKFPIKVIPAPTTNMGFDTDGSTILYSEDSLLNITKDLFIEKMGVRNPDYLSARREQRVAMIVRSQRLLTPIELSYFHKIMLEHEKIENSIYSPNAYYDLCRGEGRLITRIFDNTSSVEYKLLNQPTFNIFPNPASTKLIIKPLSGENYSIQSGQIINSLGTVVLNFKIADNPIVDITSLNSGIHFIKIKIKEEWYTQQFVKID